MKEVPKVRILKVKKDLGPITKILPSITGTRDKQSIVISIDDDVAYPLGMVNELIYQKVVKHPGAAITMGSPMPFFSEVKNMRKYWPECHNKRPFIDIVEGWSSILYTPNIVNAPCMKKLVSLGKQCFLSDDFVISYALSISNVDKITINNKYAYNPEPYDYGAGEDALHAGRGLDGGKRKYEAHSDAINFEKYGDCLKIIENYVQQVKKGNKGGDPCGFRSQRHSKRVSSRKYSRRVSSKRYSRRRSRRRTSNKRCISRNSRR